MICGVISADNKDPLYVSHIRFPINRAVRNIMFSACIPESGKESKLPDPKLVLNEM